MAEKKTKYTWAQLQDSIMSLVKDWIPALAVALWDHMQHKVQTLKNKNAKLESEKRASKKKGELRDEEDIKSNINFINDALKRIRERRKKRLAAKKRN